ncbi:unnamed protein product [Prorocentrum cordatum]|uniref:RING-CH-type domain-containing protein n=1 Tax=Prorocentrum cordatum TaxID=2364126 RepID=A0ABN9S7A7_9DINO|nr:unnamed protein product [Polarella glacialis]
MECRLCLHAVLEDASPEDAALAFPCDCRGSPVHWGCLRRWQQAQVQRAAEAARSADEARARAATCEVCGARLAAAGGRKRPLAERAVCRAHGGEGKVALRRVPTLSRASRNFSEFSAADGQEVEVLEQDDTGEFFRVRARKAPRYREQGSAALAEGWIRHICRWSLARCAARLRPPCQRRGCPRLTGARRGTLRACRRAPPRRT